MVLWCDYSLSSGYPVSSTKFKTFLPLYGDSVLLCHGSSFRVSSLSVVGARSRLAEKPVFTFTVGAEDTEDSQQLFLTIMLQALLSVHTAFSSYPVQPFLSVFLTQRDSSLREIIINHQLYYCTSSIIHPQKDSQQGPQ